MAVPWIKVRNNLRDDPRIVGIMRACGATRAASVGACVIAWCLLDEHGRDGFLPHWMLADVDVLCGIPGVAVAMRDVGWIIEGKDGLRFPRWDEHNGPGAKARALGSARVDASRDRRKSEPEPQRETQRGIPPAARASVSLDPMAEAAIAACERVTGRTPLRGHEVSAAANWAYAMRSAYPEDKAITIHGKPSTLADVVLAACEYATPERVSSRAVTGIVRWIETIVHSCVDGGIMPGERIATQPQKTRAVADPKRRERDRAAIEKVMGEQGAKP